MNRVISNLGQMFENWFLDFASYSITDRAIPDCFDGLKPVQRRLLHVLKEMDDGRYHKVANAVGSCMRYHPHGDMSIYSSLVILGQKKLLVDTQGNWGDPQTGDSAAAGRYIEARLTPFAREVLFNPDLTKYQPSYDGRNKEPIALPVKFPISLILGIEGIAVGLSTKIMPHNFNEVCDASIAYLLNKPFSLLPDFYSGGTADCGGYQEGVRGSRIKVRAKINEVDSRRLEIVELPYGVTTKSLIETILTANEKGKIKIAKIEDNTGAKISISIFLAKGTNSQKTIQALYAFTDCEVSLSPLCCVIKDNNPVFITIPELLQNSVSQTKGLLQTELLLKLRRSEQKWHLRTLERIFIEHEVYELIKTAKTEDEIYLQIEKGIKPYINELKKPLLHEDMVKLTEIKIKRISKFDSDKAKTEIKEIEQGIEQTKTYLLDMTKYTITWYKYLKKKYGKFYPRHTKLDQFDTVDVSNVVRKNLKLFKNEQGYIGTELKDSAFITQVSDIDDVIYFLNNGQFKMIRVPSKQYIGEGIYYCDRYLKSGMETVFNVVYKDNKNDSFYVKRFTIKGLIRDKEYLYVPDSDCEVHYFGTNEKVTIHLKVNFKRAKKTDLYIKIKDYLVKGRQAQGNLITRRPVVAVSASTPPGDNNTTDSTPPPAAESTPKQKNKVQIKPTADLDLDEDSKIEQMDLFGDEEPT